MSVIAMARPWDTKTSLMNTFGKGTPSSRAAGVHKDVGLGPGGSLFFWQSL